MEPLLSFLEKYLDPSISNIFILVVIGFYILYNSVTKSPDFMESLGYFNLRKIKKIEYAINSENIDHKYKSILRDHYSILQISRALSIAPNKARIERSIEAYEKIGKYCTLKEIYLSISVLGYYFHEMEINDIKIKSKIIEKNIQVTKRNFTLFFFVIVGASFYFLITSDFKITFNHFDIVMLILAFIAMALIIPELVIANLSAIKVLNSTILIKNEQEASQDAGSS